MLNTTKIIFYFQPIYDCRRKCFTKVELLARFLPTYGIMVTDTEEVISQAEKDGSIADIDLASLEFACNTLPILKKYGIEMIHVNLSPTTCTSPLLIDQIHKIVTYTKIPPQNICIELTETNFSGKFTSLIGIAEALVQLQFKLALDDVGKGASGFDRILQLPISHFKLDKSMALQFETNIRISSLISGLIQFANSSNITVTAEGIETAQMAEKMASLGCHYLQGYYYSKPLSYEDFIRWLPLVSGSASTCDKTIFIGT